MMTLTRKVRLVAVGNHTDHPNEAVYSSAISRESVMITFLVASLNVSCILVGDKQNLYLNTLTNE